MKASQRLFAAIAALSILGASVSVGVGTIAALPPRYVTTSITPIMPTVYSGEPLGYRAQAQCSNPTGCGTVQLTVPAPPAWEPSFGSPTAALSAADIAAGVTYVAQPDGTIVLTWPNALSGNTVNVQLDWPTQNYITVPGTQPMTVSVTSTAEPLADPLTDSTSNELVAAPLLSIYKEGPATSTPGGLVTYTIKVANRQTTPTSAQGGLSVVAVVEDVLPPGVTFVSCSRNQPGSGPPAPAACSYDAVTNTVTWEPDTLPWGPPRENFISDDYAYTVTYRLPATAVNGDAFTNTATITGAPLGGGAPLVVTDAVTTTVFVGAPVLASTLTKSAGLDLVQPGTSFGYFIRLTNTSNVPVDGVISDQIPAGIDVGYMSLTGATSPLPTTFTITYDDGSTEQIVNPTGQVQISRPGKRVVAVEATVAGLTPGSNVTLFITAIVTAAPGTTITNCGESTISYPLSTDVMNRACVDLPVVEFLTHARVTKAARQVTPVAVGGTVDWDFSAAYDPYGGRYTPMQPEFIDLVPTNLTYVDGSFAANPSNNAACPLASDFGVSVEADYRDGRTAVIASTGVASGGTGATLPSGNIACRYTIATTVNDATPAGVYGGSSAGYPIPSSYLGNALYLLDARDYLSPEDINMDSADVDKDGNIDEFIAGAAASFSVAQSAALKVVKWVQGDRDNDLIGSAEQDPSWFGTSSVGGTVDWEVQLGNAGNMPMNRMVAYDLLPSPNNTGVTVSRYTDTVAGPGIEWVPTMTGPIVHGPEVTISYSTNPNPCRPEMNPTGSVPVIYCSNNYQLNNDWVAEGLVTDWSAIRAIRFDFGTAAIAGGTYYNYRWTMEVPTTMADLSPMVDGAATWNKIAATGYTDIFSATPTAMLPTEAAWVKDIVHILVAVGDYAWIDADHDGIQDAGESPLPGVTVTLQNPDGSPALDADGLPVASVTTDAAGHYVFDNLFAGTYQVVFTAPAGYLTTLLNVGASGSDSNVGPSSTTTAPFTIEATATGDTRAVVTADGTSLASFINPTIDAGFFEPVSVGDFVWIDVDRDGLQDAGEPPVPGVTATLYTAAGALVTVDANGGPVVPLLTDASGVYLFTNLLPGAYVVQFSALPAGYGMTTSSNTVGVGNDSNGLTATSANLLSGQSDLTLDLGLVALDLTIAKTLVPGGPYYPGSTVVFTLVPHNNGPAAALAGWSVTEVLPAGLTLVSMTGAGYDCSGVRCTSLAGLAANAEGPTITVTATINAGVTSTQHNVAYVSPGPLEVVETNPLVVPTNTTDTTGTPTNNDDQADVPVAAVVAVGDYTWIDANHDGIQDLTEPPLPGVTVTLLNADGTPATHAGGVLVAPVVTDALGHYVFDNLLPGTYQIEFAAPVGYLTTQSNAGTSADDSNIGPSSATTATFTVEATATGDTRAVVVADGTSLASLINPTIDGGFFEPVSVGDYVFIDVNRDSLQDVTDIPVTGVTATLYEADGTTLVTVDANGGPIVPLVTDAAGRYQFTNLLPGGYVVKFTTVPAGYSPTTSADTLAVTNDSNGLTATSAVMLSGASDPTLDLGLVSLNLSLTKTLVTVGAVKPGDTVVFTLVPHNHGPVDALPGWSVTDVLPAGLILVAMTGTGYVCGGVTCTAVAGLAAGADGATITVTVTVNTGTTTSQRNVAHVTPGPGETAETNPLVVPTPGTDTTATPTDNDSHALIDIAVPAALSPLPDNTMLPSAGSDFSGHLTNSLGLFTAGCLLVLLARRRRQHHTA